MKARYKLVVDIYEPEGAGTDYPILRHEFFGRTEKEAEGYFRAHLATDTFLRGCVQKRRWRQVGCVAEIYWAPV